MYLIGASGHAKVVLEIAEELGIKVEGLLDSNPDIRTLLGYAVFHPGADERPLTELLIAIGNNSIRKKLAERYHEQQFISLIHPAAHISKRAAICAGTVVMAGVSINSSVTIGKHAIINTNASIDHDCIIENYAHISPNASLAGDVCVGEGAHVGIGACVRQGIKIGRWAVVGAGAVVVADVPPFTTVVGNPAKKFQA